MKDSNTKNNLRIPRVPLEWYAGSAYPNLENVWRLPSGKALAEFALQAGFVAPLLFKTDRHKSAAVQSQRFCAAAEGAAIGSGLRDRVARETKAAH